MTSLDCVLDVLVGRPPGEVADVHLVLAPGVLCLRPVARRGPQLGRGLLVLDRVARGGGAGRQDVVVEVVAGGGVGRGTIWYES